MGKIHDLRSFLAALRAAGLVHEIHRPVDPVQELGAVLNACEQAGRAAYFSRVKGYDIPLVGSALGSLERVAVALECSPQELNGRIGGVTERGIPATLYAGPAPCQEVVRHAPIDLMSLPIPTHAPRDGGPFITGGVAITRDPVGPGRHNLSFNRMQVKAPDRTGLMINNWRHVKEFLDKVEPQGQNLPFCVAIGVDPVLLMAAAYRHEGDEYEIAGALRQAPIPLVKAVTCDVLVPAHAEIILEGEILAGEREEEGPLAEFTGHYSDAWPSPVVRVNCITHRRQPIFQTIAGASFEHINLGNVLPREPLIERFVRHVCKKVKAVAIPPYSSGFTAIISIEKSNPGEPKNVALAAMTAHVNIKTVIVVDEDVDVHDPTAVLWALSTRVRWDQDTTQIPSAQGHELDPTSDQKGVQCKMIIDATLPTELKGHYVKVSYPTVDLGRYQRGS